MGSFMKIPELRQYDRRTSPGVQGGLPVAKADASVYGADIYKGLGRLSAGLDEFRQDIEKIQFKQKAVAIASELNQFDRDNILWTHEYRQNHKGGAAGDVGKDYSAHFAEASQQFRARYANDPRLLSYLESELAKRYNSGLVDSLAYQEKQTDINRAEQDGEAWDNHKTLLNSPNFDEEERDNSLSDLISNTISRYPHRDPDMIKREIEAKDRTERIQSSINSRNWGQAEEQLKLYRGQMDADKFYTLQSRVEAGRNKAGEELKFSYHGWDERTKNSLESVELYGVEVPGTADWLRQGEADKGVPRGTGEAYERDKQHSMRVYNYLNRPEALLKPFAQRIAEVQEEFKVAPGDPAGREKSTVGEAILKRLFKDKERFDKDPAAYLQPMVSNQIAIKEQNGDFAGLEGGALSQALAQARVGISLEMQRRLGGTRPRLFSEAYKNDFKARYEAASPAEKVNFMRDLNQTYGDLAGQAMTELGFSHYERVTAGLLTNPATDKRAGLMLELADRSPDSLLQGQNENPLTNVSAKEVRQKAQTNFINSQLGRTMRSMMGVSAADYSLQANYQAMLEGMEKLTAYYVGMGKTLSEASSLALRTFTGSYNAVSDDSAAIIIPANRDYYQVQAGLRIARQSLLEQDGIERGVWRNMGGEAIGLFAPDEGGWVLGPEGKPIQFSLNDLESLGRQGKVTMEPSSIDPGASLMYSPENIVLQNHAEVKARVQELLNQPRSSLAEQYRDMQFSASAPVREDSARGQVKGQWAEGIKSRYPQVYDKIYSTAQELGVPFDIALSVAKQESGGNPNAFNKEEDAVGIYQIRPLAAQDMGLSLEDRYDPDKNIRAGIGYLARQYKTFGNWPDALAAYNGGASHVIDKTVSDHARNYTREVMGRTS